MVKLADLRTIVAMLVAIIAISVGSALSNDFLFVVPILFVVLMILLQRPEWILYVMAAIIPWSAEITVGSFSTDVPDEPLMWWASVAAIALCFRKKKFNAGKFHPLLLLVLIQFSWTMLTVATSTHFIFSLKYLLAKTWYLLSFLVLPLALSNGLDVLKKASVIHLSSMFLVTIVVLFRHGSMGFEFATINDAVTPFFRNHVVYGAVLAFSIALLTGLYFFQDRKYVKWWIIGGMVVLFVALFFSYSRGAWLAVVLALAGVVLLRKRILFASYVVVMIGVLAFAFWLWQDERYLDYAHDYRTTVYHEKFDEHLEATYELKDVSTAERFYRWIAGARLAADHLITGTGPTTFHENYKAQAVPLFRTWVSRNEEKSTVHNYFLLVLIEQGVMGLLLLLILLGMMFWYIEKLFHQAVSLQYRVIVAILAALLIMIGTVNFLSDLIETDKVGSIFFCVLAMILLIDKKVSEAKREQ